MEREILFRKFNTEDFGDVCGCCEDCGDCDCEDCTNLNEEELLNTMDVDELLAYAAETFGVVLNKYKDEETLVDEIMGLYEAAEHRAMIDECNHKKVEVPRYARNGGV